MMSLDDIEDMASWQLQGEKVNCFEEAETALNIKLPESLKNILEVNGYNNEKLLEIISEDDFKKIETFTRSTVPKIIPTEEHEKYFGVFYKHSELYEILNSEKKLISLVSEYFKNKNRASKKANRNEQSREQSTRQSNSSTESSTALNHHDNLLAHRTPKTTLKKYAYNLTEENRKISITVNKWLKNTYKSDEEGNYFTEKVLNMKFVTKVDCNHNLICDVTCFCKKVVTLRMYAKSENYQKRWIFSNLQKHLKIHLAAFNSGEPSEEHKQKSGENSGKSTILNYFSKSLGKSGSPQENIPKLDKLQMDNSDTSGNTSASTSESKVVILENISIKAPREAPEEDKNSDRSFEVSTTSNDREEGSAPVVSASKSSVALSIWKTEKYQRCERQKRLREKCEQNQLAITTFFPVLDDLSKVINENSATKQEFLENFEFLIGDTTGGKPNVENKKTYSLLEHLLEISLQNSSKSSCANSYDDVIKNFSLYIFYIGGRLLYETLQANLRNMLPSITTLNRFVEKRSRNIEEGFFDYEGLNKFLEDRRLPKFVWISEDATRITGKIEYSKSNNKIIGFTLPLVDGLPDTEHFMALSAKSIQEYFEKGVKANYAQAIMAQPIMENAPAFCLTVFGTDNRFSFKHVLGRWKNIEENLKKWGIAILGFSTDGDTRFLKAMRIRSNLPPLSAEVQLNDWSWYRANLGFTSYVQDTVHLGAKLRTRLLKPGIILPMGNYVATVNHLHLLITKYSKDKHLLTVKDLTPDDKMNYKSAEKLCSESVLELLQHIPDSYGTFLYLKFMNYVLTSFLDKKLDISKRIYRMWYSVFFLRFWRKYIINHSKYKVGENFITSNCYISIELNAHALVNLARNFREDENLTPDMCLPWLFSSQPCEKLFRATRSMTSTFSTVVNFSMKDIITRISKIDNINRILTDLDGSIIFPREERRQLTTQNRKENPVYIHISDSDIKNIVEEAAYDVIGDIKNLGLEVDKQWLNIMDIPLRFDEDEKGLDSDGFTEESLEEARTEEHCVEEDDNNENNALEGKLWRNAITTKEYSNNDLFIDMSKLSSCMDSEAELNLKDYQDTKSDFVNENGSFLSVIANGKKMILRKSTLCWLLDEKQEKVSTDRLRRFISEKRKNEKTSEKVLDYCRENLPLVTEKISVGDWCVFTRENTFNLDNLTEEGEEEGYFKTVIVGNIISFGNEQKTKMKRALQTNILAVNPMLNDKLGCLCSWYALTKKGVLTPLFVDHSYYKTSNYRCTIPEPEMRDSNGNHQNVTPRLSQEVLTMLTKNLNLNEFTETFDALPKNVDFTDDHTDVISEHTNTSSSTSENSVEEEAIELDDSTDTESFSTDGSSHGVNEADNTFNAKTEKDMFVKKFYAVYVDSTRDSKWCIGEVDKIEGDVFLIRFLTEKAEKFVWPKKNNVVEVLKEFVFFGPINLISTQDGFLLKRHDKVVINQKYKTMKNDIKKIR